MAIEGLAIIGESINDSVPSTKKFFEANDIEGLKELATKQDEKGAAFIDVNVGMRPAEFMAEMVKNIQGVTAKPLSIDTPSPELAKAGLEAYDQERGGGKAPILNSISPLRTEMFDLLQIKPFMPILMVSERVENGESLPNKTAEDTYQTAKNMVKMANDKGLSNEQCIVDPGIAPIGSDMEGDLRRLMAALEMIHADSDLAGIHMSVGLSNFTVMLPPKRADGSPVKGALESAFLTKAMSLGLDMIIGSMVRKYAILEADHPAMQCLEDVLKTDDGMQAIMRVQEFYS